MKLLSGFVYSYYKDDVSERVDAFHIQCRTWDFKEGDNVILNGNPFKNSKCKSGFAIPVILETFFNVEQYICLGFILDDRQMKIFKTHIKNGTLPANYIQYLETKSVYNL